MWVNTVAWNSGLKVIWESFNISNTFYVCHLVKYIEHGSQNTSTKKKIGTYGNVSKKNPECIQFYSRCSSYATHM